MGSIQPDDFVMLSALQHYHFCPRQCALIHVEMAWEENRFTSEGKIMHEKVDTADSESRGDIRIEYGMPLRSLRLGLVGKADSVELHRQADGSWLPYPVEYKRGKSKSIDCDRIQLCAQALCLEEMLGVTIDEGSLFYGRTRRREVVTFDTDLRHETEETARLVHELIESGITPKPEYIPEKCDDCSLIELCLPKAGSSKKTVETYLHEITAGADPRVRPEPVESQQIHDEPKSRGQTHGSAPTRNV